MAWVVDTCVLIDVLDDDPHFGEVAADHLDRLRPEGLVVCPVSQIELGPAFCGDWRKMEEFFQLLGVIPGDWEYQDTKKGFLSWNSAIELKRANRVGKRPVADIMIGSFAFRFQGLITRNASDFKAVFPELTINEVG